MIAEQASAWHLWVFLSTNFLFRRLAKEGRKIGKLERKMLEDYSTPHGKMYFVNLSWVIPCCEQKLGIGAQAMCIACNDTSVIVINFRKSMTHAITDTYCIRFGSGRTGSKILSKFRLAHNRKLRSANRNTIDHTIACPALLLWCLAVENRGPCVPKRCSLSNCASPGDSFCEILNHWWSHGQHLLPIPSLMMAMYSTVGCRRTVCRRTARLEFHLKIRTTQAGKMS